jgi:hypothetical protein
MSVLYKTLAVIGIVLASLGTTYVVISEYASHPERIEAVETAAEQNELEHRELGSALDSLRIEQRQGNEKLDRVICILEGESPLSCERSQ